MIKIQKDPRLYMIRNNVVYKIMCKDCDVLYVGQTGRQLKTRMSEHRNHIRWNTSLTEYRLQMEHDFDWDNIQILDEELYYNK